MFTIRPYAIPYPLISAFLLFLLSGCAPFMSTPTPDYIEPITGMEFVLVKGGQFMMGDPITKSRDATPVHNVVLESFAVSMKEVTFNQYDEFCIATERTKPADNGWGRGNRPVINVSWDDAVAYTDWLSKKTGLSLSLPSEAQWEFFARAGSKKRYWTGSKMPKNSANCSNCGSQWDRKMTAPVGSFAPNRWGIYDTAGNVSEWTLDDINPDRDYTEAPADGSAWFGSEPGKKVYRGGSWKYPATRMGSAKRDWSSGSESTNSTGFRLILNDLVL